MESRKKKRPPPTPLSLDTGVASGGGSEQPRRDDAGEPTPLSAHQRRKSHAGHEGIRRHRYHRSQGGGHHVGGAAYGQPHNEGGGLQPLDRSGTFTFFPPLSEPDSQEADDDDPLSRSKTMRRSATDPVPRGRSGPVKVFSPTRRRPDAPSLKSPLSPPLVYTETADGLPDSSSRGGQNAEKRQPDNYPNRNPDDLTFFRPYEDDE